MERALFHAERGRGRTSPNPLVGAVVVTDEGIVVGQGAHLLAGGPHAETIAISEAGERARGATLYCTLEPCSHIGRTGPCTKRITAAGIRRVVVAATDRNPKVAGRGLAYLRAHGIEVVEDVEREAAHRQHAPFFTWVLGERPYVVAKIAMSADGFVGHRERRIQLTGAVADRFFHRQRAEIDAIGVGSGTVLADDPELTARGAYRFRPLTRVVFDWRARTPARARVFATLAAGPVIMVVGRSAARSHADRLQRLTDQGIELEVADEHDVRSALGRLARRDIVTLLIEGGPRLHTVFAEAGLIDRIQLVTTPHRLEHGVPAAPIVPEALRPSGRETRLGDDVLMEFDVHGID